MNKKIFFFVFGLLFFASFLAIDAQAVNTWCNSSWFEMSEINITPNETTLNYSLDMNITYRDNMNVDFSDLRFFNSTLDGEFDYWMSNKVDSSYANVTVLIQENLTGGENNTIYMCHNNPSAENVSNKDLAFLYHNNFSSQIDIWSVRNAFNGSRVDNGQLLMNNNGTNTPSRYTSIALDINLTYPFTMIFDWNYSQNHTSSISYSFFMGFINYDSTLGANADKDDISEYFYLTPGWENGFAENDSFIPSQITLNAFNQTNTNILRYRNGVQANVLNRTDPNNQIPFPNAYLYIGGVANMTIKIDNFLVRKYLSGINYSISNDPLLSYSINFTKPVEGQVLNSKTFNMTWDFINYTSVGTSLNVTCIYNIRRASGQEIENTTVECLDETKELVLSDFTEYTIHFYTNNTLNLSTYQNVTFSINEPTASAESGGGGATTTAKILCDQNTTKWTSTTSRGGNSFAFDLASPGQKRSDEILITNQKETELNVTLSCQDVNGTGCYYLTFNENFVQIDPSIFSSREVLFTLDIPKNLTNEDDALFNILLTDQVECTNILPVRVGINVVGSFIGKIFGTIELTFLKKINENFKIIKYPYLGILIPIPIILGFLTYFILMRFGLIKKQPLVITISYGTGILTAIAILVFI